MTHKTIFGSILPYKGLTPTIGRDVFVAAGSSIIGAVTLGDRANVWYNCVLRGDINEIRVGADTNIQDGSVIHVGRDKAYPAIIGDAVTVGHAATVHGCTVESNSLIGIGSVVLDGAVVEHHSMVAAGAVVSPHTRVKSGWVYAGVPAKPMRELKPEELADLDVAGERYVKYARESYLSLNSPTDG